MFVWVTTGNISIRYKSKASKDPGLILLDRSIISRVSPLLDVLPELYTKRSHATGASTAFTQRAFVERAPSAVQRSGVSVRPRSGPSMTEGCMTAQLKGHGWWGRKARVMLPVSMAISLRPLGRLRMHSTRSFGRSPTNVLPVLCESFQSLTEIDARSQGLKYKHMLYLKTKRERLQRFSGTGSYKRLPKSALCKFGLHT